MLETGLYLLIGFGAGFVLAGVLALGWEREWVHIYKEEDFDV